MTDLLIVVDYYRFLSEKTVNGSVNSMRAHPSWAFVGYLLPLCPWVGHLSILLLLLFVRLLSEHFHLVEFQLMH